MSELGIALKTIEQQRYLLNIRESILDEALKQHQQMVKAANQLTRENEKLRKELATYERGGLIALFMSAMPFVNRKSD